MNTQHLIGKRVSCVRRILYVYQGTIDQEKGDLELGFQDGSVALFTTSASGNMQVTGEMWLDSFALPLSAENAEFVRTHGKWTVFDLSTTPPACLLIGRQVSAYREIISDESGWQCPPDQCLEAVIEFGELVVRVLNWGGDEIDVEWQIPGHLRCRSNQTRHT